MNNSNLITIIIILLLIIFTGLFFFRGPSMHGNWWWGGYSDNDGGCGMMDEMCDHDDDHDDDRVEGYEIYPGDVVKKIQDNENIILLDVRNPEEYEAIHLENALLLPVGEMSAKTLADIGLGEKSKDDEIIIYCRSGARSKQAYDIMNSLGYTNIKSISGGMVHWQEDKYPFTEKGEYKESAEDRSTDDSSGAKISLNKTSYDFGDVPQSKGVLETTFEIENTGDEVLIVGDLTTSCGCTTAELSNYNIKPNEKATLTVFFDPNFHKEPADELTRTVFIPTNDVNNKEAEVKITVDILEGV